MISLVVYNYMMILSIFFAWLGGLSKSKLNKFFFVFISFLIIIFPTVIRFDLGPDYYGYVNIFDDLRYRDQPPIYVEYSFFYISKLFRNIDFGYVYILSVYSFLSLLILYYYSGAKHLPYVLFLFFTTSVGYFTFDDQVRQFLAISIWILSVRFIVERKFLHYVTICSVASFFHFSAILLIPFYFIARLTLSVKSMIFIFILMVLVFYFNASSFIFKQLFELVPYYNKYAHQADYVISGTATSTGLGVLLNMFVFMYAILYREKAGHIYLSNLLFWGVVLMLFSSGNLNITRFSKYFLYLGVFLLAQVLYLQRSTIHKLLIVLLMIIFFERSIVNREYRDLGYQTIFSDNFANQTLRRNLIN